MHRGPSQAEIEYLALRCGEGRANDIARTFVCARCPLATDCACAFSPDLEDRRLAPKGCLTTPAQSFALAY